MPKANLSAPATDTPKKRGRPRGSGKAAMQLVAAPGLGAVAASAPVTASAPEAVMPKKRGRPRKVVAAAPEAQATVTASPETAPVVRKRGRPRKVDSANSAPAPAVVRTPRTQESVEMMELRRANLMVLTDFQGGKTGIGKLMNKSPANISHVLHGKKKFTREVGVEFESALGLPDGWMDSPRTASDVPEQVKSLILNAFGQKSGAVRAATPRVVRPAAPARPTSPGARGAVAEMLTPTAARRVLSDPTTTEQLAVEMGQLGALQARPLAQALVRVIVLLSRSNELSEDKCLRLLNEVTLMAAPQTASA